MPGSPLRDVQQDANPRTTIRVWQASAGLACVVAVLWTGRELCVECEEGSDSKFRGGDCQGGSLGAV